MEALKKDSAKVEHLIEPWLYAARKDTALIQSWP